MKQLRLIAISGMLAAGLCSIPAWSAQHEKTGKSTTVTGCLVKGDQANEYKITENGVTYDLYAMGNLDMSKHVGHKVSVTGKTASSQPNEKNTASRTTEERLDVTNLKHISSTCP